MSTTLFFRPALKSCGWSVLLILALLGHSLPSVFGKEALAPKSKEKKKTDKKTAEPGEMTVEQVAAFARKSLVVISHFGRDGNVDGVGAGFVIDANGLIATSFHVIGEARPVKVQFADGRNFEVTEVYAWDRKQDLAVLRIDAKGLTPLPLGDSDSLKQGSQVVAMGNPQGLDFSIVEGVVSARRDFDVAEMIQLAIPVEPGNSGGPLLDMQGRVHGVLTLKSAVTRNLGFAMPINALKPLLEKPNAVPMEKWLTIGSLRAEEWTSLFGSRWTQRGGHILVEGLGKGFGGRSLCLSQKKTPEIPFELAVTVRLDDEAGAAGLAFGSDGENAHYGFYPSAGHLKLTRFDGPDVFSWSVIKEVSNPYYQPGDWNTLRVRVEADRILCYVNNHLAIQAPVEEPVHGKIGLAKFRQTKAEFKGFQFGAKLESPEPSAELVAAINAKVANLSTRGKPDPDLVEELQKDPETSQDVLAERARKLEKQAVQLRKLAQTIHSRHIQNELLKVLDEPENKIDLFQAALLVAKLDDTDLDLAAYQQELNRMAQELISKFEKDSSADARLKKLTEFLFQESGFHGSRSDYYNRANSYINQVLDDREGIPITLSVLYMELARRAGIDTVVGIALPGHFVVEYQPQKGDGKFIDVYENGKPMSRLEAEIIVRSNSEENPREDFFKPATKRQIIVRMLRNLVGVAMKSESVDESLKYLDVILALDPDAAMEHWSRGMLRLRNGDDVGGKQDFKWLLDHEPAGIDLERVAEIYRSL